MDKPVRQYRFTKCVVLAASLIFAAKATAEIGDRYCGIYAVYGAASALSRSADFQQLVDPEYVSGRAGSTIRDLLESISKCGLSGTPYSRLTLSSLKRAKDPLILHTFSDGQVESFNHWLLFLGYDQGKFRILDPDSGLIYMDSSSVLACWNGIAIAVHDGDSPKTNYGHVQWRHFLKFLVLIGIALASWNALAGKRESKVKCSGLLLITTVSIGMFTGFATEQGIGRNENTVRYLAAASIDGGFPPFSQSEMVEYLRSLSSNPKSSVVSKKLIVDARYESDARQGMISDAINIPVGSTASRIRELVEGISRNQEVVIYCQSSQCNFDNQVGIKLRREGFDQIRTCAFGWNEWNQ